MFDWAEYVRQNLRLRGFRPEREAEIVEEVARQLEDAHTEALRLGASEERAGEIARRHIVDWAALAHELEEAQRGKESAMTTWQHNAEDRALRQLYRRIALAPFPNASQNARTRRSNFFKSLATRRKSLRKI